MDIAYFLRLLLTYADCCNRQIGLKSVKAEPIDTRPYAAMTHGAGFILLEACVQQGMY